MGRAYAGKFYGILLLLLLSTVGCKPPPKNSVNRYYIPNNYVGRVRIEYGVPGTPPLEPDGKQHRIVRVSRSGVVKTSSPPFYGSQMRNCSGSLGRQYYYVDDRENIVRQLFTRLCPQDAEIIGEATGGNDTAFFFVGTEEDSSGNNSCLGGQRQPDGSVFWSNLPFDPNFDNQQEFYIPDQHVGYVRIIYDQAGYPELPTDPKSGKRLHSIPSSGILCTSSEELWKAQRNCNQKRRNYFYDSDLPKEERQLIEDKTLWNPEYSAIDSIYTLTIFIGTRDEFKQYGMGAANSFDKKFGGKRLDDGTVVFPKK